MVKQSLTKMVIKLSSQIKMKISKVQKQTHKQLQSKELMQVSSTIFHFKEEQDHCLYPKMKMVTIKKLKMMIHQKLKKKLIMLLRQLISQLTDLQNMTVDRISQPILA